MVRRKTKRIEKDYKPIIKGHKTGLKLNVFEVVPMGREGLRMFPPKLRSKVNPYVFKYVETWGGRDGKLPLIDVRHLQSIEAIKDFVLERYGAGVWDLRGFSGSSRNSYRVKNVRFALVTVQGSGDNYKASVNLANAKGIIRLSRLWFWIGDKKNG